MYLSHKRYGSFIERPALCLLLPGVYCVYGLAQPSVYHAVVPHCSSVYDSLSSVACPAARDYSCWTFCHRFRCFSCCFSCCFCHTVHRRNLCSTILGDFQKARISRSTGYPHSPLTNLCVRHTVYGIYCMTNSTESEREHA